MHYYFIILLLVCDKISSEQKPSRCYDFVHLNFFSRFFGLSKIFMFSFEDISLGTQDS